VNIIIETIVGRRPKGDLRPREEVLHRLGQHMRIVMAKQLERVLFVARRHQRQGGIPLERPVEVAQFAINPRRQRRLRQPRPDCGGDIPRGRPLGHFANRAIEKGDLEHLGHGQSL
jgi:hypothetical protein